MAEEIIKYLISVGGFSALLVFVSRFLFNKFFDFAQDKYKAELDKELEKYKNELSSEMEKYKAALNLANAEQSIRFTKLHEKRAQIIEHFHQLLLIFQSNLSALTSIYQGPEWHSDTRKQVAARDSMMELADYYNQSRIYLPVSACILIEEFKKKGLKVISDFFAIQIQGTDDKDSQPEIRARWQEINGVVNEQINRIRLSLENTFRIILGDPNSEGAELLAGHLFWNES